MLGGMRGYLKKESQIEESNRKIKLNDWLSCLNVVFEWKYYTSIRQWHT